MRVTCDPTKSERNFRERGLSFEEAASFSFETALYAVDERKSYPQTRYVAIGLLGERLHVLCFTEVLDGIRVIGFRKAMPARSRDMPKPNPLTNPSGDVRELTTAELEHFRGVGSLPASVQRKIGIRGPQKSPTKERITIRLSRDVVERFRATGEGWQTRVDTALQEWLRKHKLRV